VDEVLELLLVLVCVPVWFVAEHSPLLDEILKRGLRVARGAKAQLAGGFRRRQASPPADQVEELRR